MRSSAVKPIAALLLIVSSGFLLYALFQARIPGPSAPGAGRDLAIVGEPLWVVPDFQLLNCDGLKVNRSDLAGKVWLADFIFTRCAGPCPRMTRRMAEIQDFLKADDDFRLVSFSIDPEYDRPSILFQYATSRGANLDKWYFLTGADFESMQRLAADFKIAAHQNPVAESDSVPDITHGSHLLLVDRQGRVRALFRADDDDMVERVTVAVEHLVRESAG